MTAKLFVLTNEDNDYPTKPIPNLPSSVLSALARVERLAELAIERLTIDPDEHSTVAALEDLSQIRSVARSVLR